MNSTTLDQLFAAKERLHQLTEKAREEGRLREAQAQTGGRQVESNRQEEEKRAKAREEESYLRKHNKTVKQVLSQAAKLARREGEAGVSSGEEESDAEGDDETSEWESGEGERGANQIAGGSGEHVGEPKANGRESASRKCSDRFTCLLYSPHPLFQPSSKANT